MFRLNEKREKTKPTKISKLRVKWSWNCFLRNLRRKILEKLAGLFFFFKEYLFVHKLKIKGYKVKGRFSSSCLFSALTLSSPTSYPSPSVLEVYLLSSVLLPHQQQCFSTSALGMGGLIPPLAPTTHHPPHHRWRSQADREVERGDCLSSKSAKPEPLPSVLLCPSLEFLL